METNTLPKYDTTDNPTECCPRFHPGDWEGKELHFEDKSFLKEKTLSAFHIPINMASVFAKTLSDIEKADATNDDNFAVFSHDTSPWKAEHFFAVDKPVPGHEMVSLSGDYLTKVFEGPFYMAPKWAKEMEHYVAGKGRKLKKTYFMYTTCPKCAKFYGENFVIAVAEVE